MCFEYHRTLPLFITLALTLYGMEMSPFSIQLVLKHMKVDVRVDAISRWLERYIALVEKYADSIKLPNLGSKLGADEKRQDVKGNTLSW